MLLVERGLLTPGELEAARRIASERGDSVEECITAIGALSEDQVSAATAEEAGLELVFPYAASIEPRLIGRLGAAALTRHEALPLHEEDGAIVVAFARPPPEGVLRELERRAGARIRAVLAAPRRIAAILDDLAMRRDARAPAAGQPPTPDGEGARRSRHDPAAILTLYGRIAAAIELGAVEIRFEPDAGQGVIRVRIRQAEGAPLEDAGREPIDRLTALVSRTRILAGVSGSAAHAPGALPRVRTEVGGRRVDIDAAILPTRDGDSIRVGLGRLPEPYPSIDALPISPEERSAVAALVAARRGRIEVDADEPLAAAVAYAIAAAALPSERAAVTLERNALTAEPRFRQVEAPHGTSVADLLPACLAHEPEALFVGEPLEGAAARALASFGRRGLAIARVHSDDAPLPGALRLRPSAAPAGGG